MARASTRREGVTSAAACGKVILFGEHAVVYGRPAIAAPVTQVQAQATVENIDDRLTIIAMDLGRRHRWGDPVAEDLKPLVLLVATTLAHLGTLDPPRLQITIRSTIPIARGLGSGAAASTALVRAMSQHLGYPLTPEEVSQLVYQAERFYHGTPSGIDNTVIAYEKPIYFIKDREPEIIPLGEPLDLVIADSGVQSPTKTVVGDVREARDREPARYEAIFDQIEKVAAQARPALAAGEVEAVGQLISKNHGLLRELGVSSPLLDSLVEAAQEGGAWGAKLSGAGRGGNIIALVPPAAMETVAQVLLAAGATSTLYTRVA